MELFVYGLDSKKINELLRCANWLSKDINFCIDVYWELRHMQHISTFEFGDQIIYIWS